MPPSHRGHGGHGGYASRGEAILHPEPYRGRISLYPVRTASPKAAHPVRVSLRHDLGPRRLDRV